jgi:hypothetical protein
MEKVQNTGTHLEETRNLLEKMYRLACSIRNAGRDTDFKSDDETLTLATKVIYALMELCNFLAQRKLSSLEITLKQARKDMIQTNNVEIFGCLFKFITELEKKKAKLQSVMRE